MRRVYLLMLLALCGCDKPEPWAPPAPEPSELGRWTIIPASNAAVNIGGAAYFFAWRLDTKTGGLELCTYDPGGPATTMPERLTCSAQSSAP